jgi:kynurenine formamidase
VSSAVPEFDDLPQIEKLGLRYAWGVFGEDDQLGAVNFLTPERVRKAAGLVRTGEVVNVTLPLTAFNPPLYGRAPLEHTLFQPDRNSWDDRLDAFYLQGSTHWDGLRHIRAREFGFWGGATDEKLEPGPGFLGIEHWVEHGFVGRGVLLDVAKKYEAEDPAYDPFEERSVTGTDLEETAELQGVELEPGDILCLRLGWMGKYQSQDAEGKDAATKSYRFVGVAADEEISRWLWNHNVVAIACDNPAGEVSPGDPLVGSLHRRIVPLLGMVLGELFDFERLAEACAADRRYDFLFVAVPLNLPGGVGSPANAVAIR